MKVSSILLYLSACLQLGKYSALQYATVAYPINRIELYETDPTATIYSYEINTVENSLFYQACSKLDEINQNYNFTFNTDHFTITGNEIANETEHLTLIINDLPKLQTDFSNHTTNLLHTDSVYGLINILNITSRVKRSTEECDFNFLNKTSLNCVTIKLKTQAINTISQKFKQNLASWMIKDKLSPSNLRQLAYVLKIENYSTDSPEKIKSQLLRLLSPNIQNDDTRIGSQFIQHTSSAIDQFTVFSNKHLLLQANTILQNYKKNLKNMAKKIKNKQLKTPLANSYEKTLNITLYQNHIFLVTQLLKRSNLELYLYKTVPLCGYELCIIYKFKPFAATMDLRHSFSLDNCQNLEKNTYKCNTLTSAQQLKCVFGEIEEKSTHQCNYRVTGKVTEFSSIKGYQNYKVGYTENITSFGNIVLYPDFLYRLSVSKDRELMINDQEIKFYANQQNIFDFEALKLKMTRPEIDIAANKLIFNSKFQNIFTHSTLNTSFIVLLLTLIVILIICRTKKQCEYKTYTQSPTHPDVPLS